MTMPNMQQVPTAQRPWQQQPGGYPGAEQAPPMPGMMQQPQFQQQQMQLPPQMQQPDMGQLNGPPSPLSQMPPTQFPQQQRQQQQPAQQQTQYPPQPGMYPQQQVPPQQAAVLSGPGVPAELQGRTLQEAISIYNGMRQTHLQQMAVGQQQQAPVQQQNAQQQTNQSQAPAAFDWRNPAASMASVVDERLNQVIDQRLMPMLAPIAQQNAINGVQNARQQAAAAIGVQNWTAMEPEILAALNGANPQHLANPQTWLMAAKVVLGERAMRGQFQQPVMQQPLAPGAYPAQQVQPGQNPMPNMNSFFTEQPMQGGPAGGGVQLSNAQRQAANAMGIDPATYAAWSVGIGRNG